MARRLYRGTHALQRVLWGSLLAALLGGVAIPTGSFTAVTFDRGAEVDVVDDQSADGDLYVDTDGDGIKEKQGQTATFFVSAGATKAVDIEVPSGGGFFDFDYVEYEVQSTAGVAQVSLTRSSYAFGFAGCNP